MDMDKDWEEQEKEILGKQAEKDKKNRKKMKVSGKNVFIIQKEIKEKDK